MYFQGRCYIKKRSYDAASKVGRCMERVNKIFNSTIYKDYLNRLEAYEEKREFCRHNLEHFLDMSRIAYMMVLEKNLQYSKEVIYAIGLLHDIGRVEQYEKGIGHHIASFNIAKEILRI